MEGETLGLIQTARQGDLKAFNRLVMEYQDGVYNLACRALGDETAGALAAQQAFLRAYRELRRYRDGSWRAWLYRWVVQACRALRGHPRQAGPGMPKNGPSDLETLPFDLRLVVALVDLEGLGYDETAAILEISPLKVMSRLARARQQLVKK